MSGNARGPSTAFCCLWKMFKMKPTHNQIRSAIEHRDSPYIRAVSLYIVLLGDASQRAATLIPPATWPLFADRIPVPSVRCRSKDALEVVRALHH